MGDVAQFDLKQARAEKPLYCKDTQVQSEGTRVNAEDCSVSMGFSLVS